jgi:hypothetical protein
MDSKPTLDQIQYIFTFPFQEKGWANKFLIGFLLYSAGFLIPILPWIFISGYFAKIVEISLEGEELVLPDWDDWGDLFRSGFRLMAFGFIVMLPVLVLLAAGYAAFLAPALSSAFSDPSYSNQLPADFLLRSLMGMFGGMLLMGVATITGLLVSFFIPPALTHMIAEGQFKAAFHFRSWWRVFRINIGGFLISYILAIGIAFSMTFVFQLMYMTLILCIAIPVLISLVSVYLAMVMGAMFGQNYRVGKERLSAEIPPADGSLELPAT